MFHDQRCTNAKNGGFGNIWSKYFSYCRHTYRALSAPRTHRVLKVGPPISPPLTVHPTPRPSVSHLVEDKLRDVLADGGEGGRVGVPRQHKDHAGRRLSRGDGAVPLPGRGGAQRRVHYETPRKKTQEREVWRQRGGRASGQCSVAAPVCGNFTQNRRVECDGGGGGGPALGAVDGIPRKALMLES